MSFNPIVAKLNFQSSVTHDLKNLETIIIISVENSLLLFFFKADLKKIKFRNSIYLKKTFCNNVKIFNVPFNKLCVTIYFFKK